MSQINSVPLLDTTRIPDACSTELKETCARILDSGQFILGPEVDQFEAEMANYLGTSHAIGVSSGTDALILALMALGVKAGDEVICPSFTFFATAGAIWRLGAVPVFVDIEPDTFNISAQSVHAAITSKTRAIMPVHLFGQMANMEALTEVAKAQKISIIEDAAQAIGSETNGQKAGTIGQFGAFSFFPTKNLGGYGDAGLVTTNDDALAAKARVLRVHGAEKRYYHEQVGGNFRIDALQAGLLRTRFKHLGTGGEARKRWANLYSDAFTDAGITAPGATQITVPREITGKHVFNQYTLRASSKEHRSHILRCLQTASIGHSVYYPVPLHLQSCFSGLGYKLGDLPETEKAADTVFSIPVFPQLTQDEHRYVTETIIEAAQSFKAGS